jgi:hypothetical protein
VRRLLAVAVRRQSLGAWRTAVVSAVGSTVVRSLGPADGLGRQDKLTRAATEEAPAAAAAESDFECVLCVSELQHTDGDAVRTCVLLAVHRDVDRVAAALSVVSIGRVATGIS